MRKKGFENDGLMPIDNTFLPGASRVYDLAGPDHAAVVLPLGTPWDFDRVRFTQALLSLVL